MTALIEGICNTWHIKVSNITGGMDYDSRPYTVTFRAMQTRTSFSIPLSNDDAFEDNEKFLLTIKPSSLLNGITPGNPSKAIVTIVDIEGK